MTSARPLPPFIYGAILVAQIAIPFSSSDFVFYNPKKSKEDASAYCIDQGYAGLAVLDTQAKMDAVFSHRDYKSNKEYWVGLENRDVNKASTGFTWDSDPDQDGSTVWIQWASSEPDDLRTDLCAMFDKGSRLLETLDCSDKNAFICQDVYDSAPVRVSTATNQVPADTNPFQYTFYNNVELTRPEALRHCLDNGHSGLVILNSQNRLDILVADANYVRTNEYWLGMSQYDDPPTTNGFRWDSDRSQSWANWNGGQPNEKDDKLCVYLKKNTHKYSSQTCDKAYAFVCQDGSIQATTVLPITTVTTADSLYEIAFYNSEKVSRSEAEEKCVQKGFSGLASLDSSVRMEYAFEQAGYDDKHEYWIGLQQADHDNPSTEGFRWDLDQTKSWAKWSHGEPKSVHDKMCVRLKKSQEMATQKCSHDYYFICQRGAIQGTTLPTTTVTIDDSLYEIAFYNSEKVSRSEAETKCVQKGFSGLASLDSRAKMDYAFRQVDYDDKHEYWIGLQQQDHDKPTTEGFRWDLDQTKSWAKWSHGEPKSVHDKMCVRLKKSQEMATQKCSHDYYFICQRGDFTSATTTNLPTTTTTTTTTTTVIPASTTTAEIPTTTTTTEIPTTTTTTDMPTTSTISLSTTTTTAQILSTTTTKIPASRELTTVMTESTTAALATISTTHVPIITMISSYFVLLAQNAVPKDTFPPSVNAINKRSELECILSCIRSSDCRYTVFFEASCSLYDSTFPGVLGATEFKAGPLIRAKEDEVPL